MMKATKSGARRRTFSADKRFMLGAAIGTGMAAKAAERGGADFLLALNAGRFRSMGMPSVACLLALRDANRMVMEFGRSEILTQTSLPVFFGAAALGTEDAEDLVRQIAEAGFHGVTNFPSCIFLDGRYREYLEESGLGFSREVALLRAARARGLSTLAYVHTLEEARVAAASADIVNLDFGWNMGGLLGVQSSVDLDEAARLGRTFVETVRSVNPRARCVIEGGPIVTPEQMDQVCRAARADGYVGGSTIDRVPLESAIEMATGAFKTIGVLRQQIEALERKLHRKAVVDVLIGHSEVIERAREQVAQALESQLPVLIEGEPGTGRHTIAKVIHQASAPQGRRLLCADCRGNSANEIEATLFGSVGDALRGDKSRAGLLELARGSSLLLDHVEVLDIGMQRQLLQTVRMGGFSPTGGADAAPLAVRFIGIQNGPTLSADTLEVDFSRWLGSIRIELPALRDHLEDLPMLAEVFLRGMGAGKKIEPSAYRALLGYHWPGNVDELRSLLQLVTAISRGRSITEGDIVALLKARTAAASDRRSFASEREWIMDGLRRNRFRRVETAQFLRISRKTLYNKMRKYGLENCAPRITH
jgi:predicted TIM-barrel enzyme/DNA-binding NtrC family response regulator